MKNIFFLFLTITILSIVTAHHVGLRRSFFTEQPQRRAAMAQPKIAVGKVYGKLPLLFETNQGQTDPQVKFLARGDGYQLFLTPTEVVLTGVLPRRLLR